MRCVWMYIEIYIDSFFILLNFFFARYLTAEKNVKCGCFYPPKLLEHTFRYILRFADTAELENTKHDERKMLEITIHTKIHFLHVMYNFAELLFFVHTFQEDADRRAPRRSD